MQYVNINDSWEMMENNIENLHPKGQVGIEPGANRYLAVTLDHYTTEVLLLLQMY